MSVIIQADFSPKRMKLASPKEITGKNITKQGSGGCRQAFKRPKEKSHLCHHRQVTSLGLSFKLWEYSTAFLHCKANVRISERRHMKSALPFASNHVNERHY